MFKLEILQAKGLEGNEIRNNENNTRNLYKIANVKILTDSVLYFQMSATAFQQ